MKNTNIKQYICILALSMLSIITKAQTRPVDTIKSDSSKVKIEQINILNLLSNAMQDIIDFSQAQQLTPYEKIEAIDLCDDVISIAQNTNFPKDSLNIKQYIRDIRKYSRKIRNKKLITR